ncbi:MAG: PAS domain S-box protein [Bacteroidales bacterium]|jgi:PAS domain S-box-containing protein|nr:PAS domain S-box protein [Bacteroidales bacterium]MDD4087138.1 PAS domain S-box protein [Bacteroidales bacterium]MDY0084347.1 PAS domain S-box protein [Bacteroidales bacterium]
MIYETIFISASFILRLVTFAVVMNYVNISKHRIAWWMIAAAMILMALENLFQLLAIEGISDLAVGTKVPPVAGFMVSLLMLSGTLLIRNILKRLSKAERTRLSINHRYQMLFNTSSDQIFVIATDGQILEVNQAACERLEFSREELLNRSFASLKSGQNAEGVLDHLNEIRQHKMYIFETELLSGKGKRIPVEMSCRLIEIDEKPCITCVARSISARKELEKRVLIATIETEENERSRFAREIHDGLGPLLSTIKLYVNELEHNEKKADHDANIQYINKLINEAVSSARNIANNITPKIITDYGLIRSLENFCQSINATKLLEISFMHEALSHTLGSTIELTLYRIITELINNTIKHAQAQQVHIKLLQEASRIRLSYHDDGIGFELDKALEKSDQTLGLKNIISRVRSLKGSFSFRNTRPGIEILIDLDAEQGK